MKTIGIKLADGSFYPILEEGTAEKKEINLTTVKDNQTIVQVDLYRSESGTMQDAEYVDSLEIKNLVKHPNGEPDISLDISLDENNQLKAELHDPETGKDSSTTVSLVSRSEELRNEPSDVTQAETSDFQIDESEDFSTDLDFDAESFDLDESLSSEPQESFAEDDDLTFDPNSLNVDSIVEETESSAETSDETETEEIKEEDSSDATAAVVAGAAGLGLLGAASALAANKDEETESSDTTIDNFSVEDFSIPDDFDTTDSLENEDSDDDFENIASVEESDFSAEDFSIPDSFDEPVDFESTEDSDNFDIPETSDSFDNSESLDVFESDTNDIFNSENSFSETETSDTELSDFNTEDLFEEKVPDNYDSTTQNGNAGLDFSDILDEETKEGHAGTDENDNCKKKIKIPVIICIICAIICIIAVLLILFVFPTKLNILKSGLKSGTATTEPVVTEQSAPSIQETTKEPEYEAKENEIVVAPAEAVIPEVPQVAENENRNITYKIKWGDTLWDISKSYYNNPWKYHKIAKYNGIKNPDHIISGTKIVIPAE